MLQSGDESYKIQRLELINTLKSEGLNIYPHKFETSHSVQQSRELSSNFENGQESVDILIHCSGRIMGIRESGAKLVFLDLMGDFRHSVQIIVRENTYQSEGANTFERVLRALRTGDVVGVIGHPAKSKSGESSIMASRIIPLSWCLHMLPARNKLTDDETRWRERHLDLIVNDRSFEIALKRTKIVRGIREFFWDLDFLEVETPVLSLLAGGANALPFITHLNALKLDMFLRIAPELALKQLVVGGMSRVFEIGKNYRNEGADRTHNPEFSAIEAYWAGVDYHDLMKMTENLLERLAIIATGSHIVSYTNGEGITHEINFRGPYPRYPMIATLEEKLRIIFPSDLSSEETRCWLDDVLIKNNVDCEPPRTTSRMLDKLVGEFIEPLCNQPTFIIDHPQLMCPLAKWHRNDVNRLTERFELFVCGKELCNAYTELNDPDKQRAGFVASSGDRDAGDAESMPTDEAFCRALEYGLHPTGGWGMGIDRLVMFLTNCVTIKDVILFPTMKPTAEDIAAQDRVRRNRN